MPNPCDIHSLGRLSDQRRNESPNNEIHIHAVISQNSGENPLSSLRQAFSNQNNNAL